METRLASWILGAVVCALSGALSAGCGQTAPIVMPVSASSDYASPVMTGRIETADVKESSGLAASRCQADVLWTHNDAGSDAFIFGLSPEGKNLGTWKVQDARNTDWEDIESYKDASGKCFLLVGDIGDNEANRTELTVYRIPEPTVPADGAGTTIKNALLTAPAESLKFGYSNSRHNAETLLVHPQTGDIYILTKTQRGPSEVHRLKPAFGGSPIKTEKIGELSVPSNPEGLLTGGSISPDGSRVILCDVKNGYELKLPREAGNFNAIWTQTPITVDIGERKQGEGVTYSADGTSIYASSEKKNAPLFQVKRS